VLLLLLLLLLLLYTLLQCRCCVLQCCHVVPECVSLQKQLSFTTPQHSSLRATTRQMTEDP
jgi:hypothetical protein